MTSSERVRRSLRIQLESDLCVASGDGFSSGIDVDVCCGDHGLPIIPSRRLKGCLRDAALDVLSEKPSADEGDIRFRSGCEEYLEPFYNLFGKSGEAEGGSLRISPNAIIANPGRLAKSVEANLDRFTYVRAQTAIDEDGHADDNTLRFVRVVKQYNPSTGDKAVFEAAVSCDAGRQLDLLEMACKALRNIGYGRNRGFGAVSCTLDMPEMQVGGATVENLVALEAASSGTWRIDYAVLLDGPLMLPARKGVESIDCIPGSSALGFFASRLKQSPNFDEMFLKGRVRFSPLYPTGADGKRCKPAPPFIVKVKGGGHDGEYRTSRSAAGLTVKPLKSGFVDGNYHPVDVGKKIVYHHRRHGGEMLYTQQCLSAGQTFAGFVEGPPELLAPIARALEEAGPGEISFGRSKSAQYAGCTLERAAAAEAPRPTMSLERGRDYALLLDSDLLLVDDEGRFTTDYSRLAEAVSEAFGVSCEFDVAGVQAEEDARRPLATSIKYLTVTGYNAKWNHKKPHVRAFAAGSCLVFRVFDEVESVPAEVTVGERRAEGYGRVVLVEADGHGVPIIPVRPLESPVDVPVACDASPEAESDFTLPEGERMEVVEFAEANRWRFRDTMMNAAFVGRLTRMAEESDSRADYFKRIESIKTERKREDADEVSKELLAKIGASNRPWSQQREALVLLFTFGKYFAKQESQKAVEGR